MNSCLYQGTIEHRRFSPKKNIFTYNVLYYFLDLDEIQSFFNWPLLISHDFPGLLSFWRKDYLGQSQVDLKESVQQFIIQNGGERVTGKIFLLTNISYFGFCFNPVSFYYCYSQTGELLYIVSEITNTPWGERHQRLFFIEGDKKVFTFPKTFHVSPFMPMAIDYTWVFHRPSEDLFVLMQDRERGQKVVIFDSTLRLKRLPLTKKSALLSFLRFPLITIKTLSAIYWQALKLHLKNVPFYTHPKKEKVHDHSTLT